MSEAAAEIKRIGKIFKSVYQVSGKIFIDLKVTWTLSLPCMQSQEECLSMNEAPLATQAKKMSKGYQLISPLMS